MEPGKRLKHAEIQRINSQRPIRLAVHPNSATTITIESLILLSMNSYVKKRDQEVEKEVIEVDGTVSPALSDRHAPLVENWSVEVEKSLVRK